MSSPITPTPPPVASYPFQDIEDNSGLVTYYLYSSQSSTGNLYHLTKAGPYSSTITLIHTGASVFDLDFDTGEFNTPRVLEGTATFTFAAKNNRTVAGAHTLSIFIKIYHYDGSTETQIGSTWQNNVADDGTGVGMVPQVAKISLPRTKFKRGEQIRVSLSIVKEAGGLTSEIGIDPMNRDGTNITPSTNANDFTIFKASMPFRINT